MSHSEPPVQSEVDSAELKALIGQYAALEAKDPRAFAQAIADNIMDPIPEETEAFRSEILAQKSLAATRYLIDHTNEIMRNRRRGSDSRRRTAFFVNNVGRERRLLENIVAGQRARKGYLPNSPNPRQRAMRRLATENLKGDVARGRFRDILEEERREDAERKRLEKDARRQARREAREAETRGADR